MLHYCITLTLYPALTTEFYGGGGMGGVLCFFQCLGDKSKERAYLGRGRSSRSGDGAGYFQSLGKIVR